MRAAAAALLTVLALAGCQKPDTAQAEIQARYDAYAKAYAANDVEAIVEILDPSYKLTDAEGKIHTLSEYRSELEARREKGDKTASYRVEIESFIREGDQASVITREISSTISDPTAIHRYRDVWVLRDGVWKLKSSTTVEHG